MDVDIEKGGTCHANLGYVYVNCICRTHRFIFVLFNTTLETLSTDPNSMQNRCLMNLHCIIMTYNRTHCVEILLSLSQFTSNSLSPPFNVEPNNFVVGSHLESETNLAKTVACR